MATTQLPDDRFLRILWDEKTKIISIDWKDSTSAMTVKIKQELTPFAARVEEKRTPAILVDVTRFRHRPDPEFMP